MAAGISKRRPGWGIWGRMETCTCVTESPCCSPEIITFLISYTPTQSKKFFFKKGRISSSQGRWLLKSTWVLYLASKCWHAIGFHCLLILWLHPLRFSCLYYDNAVHVSVPRTLLSDLSSTHLPAILMLAKHILALATFLIKILQCLLVPCRLKQILFNFGKMDPLSMML